MSQSDEEGAYASADEGEKTSAKADANKSKDSADTGDVAKDFEFLSMNEDKFEIEKPAEDVKSTEPVETTAEAAPITPDEKTNPEPSHTEKQKVMERLAEAARANTGWAWSGISTWSSNVIQSATSSVQTFADQVGEGLHVVFDPLDAEADSISQADAIQKKSAKPPSSPESTDSDSPVIEQPYGGGGGVVEEPVEGAIADGSPAKDSSSWFPGWGLGGITTAVKKTVKDTTDVFKEQGKTLVSGSKHLVSGSLDMLESIGKKTYDVIAEGDHGLKSTIKKSKEKANLSQMLREAKERAEHNTKEEEEFAETRKVHFGAQFDEFQGLVQLEALEMLSNQCEGRVQAMLTPLKGEQRETVKSDLIALKHAFKLEDMEEEDGMIIVSCSIVASYFANRDENKDHDFDRLIAEFVGQCGLNTTPERLIHVQEKYRKYLMDCQRDIDEDHPRTAKEIHETAIQSLAEFTARCIEHYHRVGQLILLDKSIPLSSYKTKATSLASATKVLCTEVGIFSVKFAQCLSKIANKLEESSTVNPMITNVYLEASNSSTYIQDAFLLLLPVLQQGTIEAHQREPQVS